MRTIEEIEALLLVMGVEMFYIQQKSDKLWWAKIDDRGLVRLTDMHTGTTPLYTTIDEYHGYFGLYPTKEEALNAALDKYIGETK